MGQSLPVDTPAFWIEQWNAMNAGRAAFGGYGSAATWNAMAASYGGHASAEEKTKQIDDVVAAVERKGLDFDGARVLDVGCGTGGYAEAFVRKGAEVVCVDIAEKMIQRLEAEVAPDTRTRIHPHIADWRSLDLSALGFESAFDLVFANMTPAVAGPEEFLKLMRASRNLCWFQGWAGPREDSLLDYLHRELAGEPPPTRRGNFFHAFNLVCASGCFPDCSFAARRWSRRKTIEEWTAFYSVFFTHATREASPEAKIRNRLGRIAVDGYVEQHARGRTGRMLWSVTPWNGGERQ